MFVVPYSYVIYAYVIICLIEFNNILIIKIIHACSTLLICNIRICNNMLDRIQQYIGLMISVRKELQVML